MRNFLKTALIWGLLSFPILNFGQTQNIISIEPNQENINNEEFRLNFSEITEENGKQIVKFNISSLDSELQKKELYTSLINDSKIHSVDINQDYQCKFVTDIGVSPEYVQEILFSYSTDYLYKYVQREKVIITQGIDKKQKTKIYLESYPKRGVYSKDEQGESDYNNACQDWKKSHPKEWMSYMKSK